MTNSKRLKRTFSHAIKSSSGDCELRETYKSPVLWLQFLLPSHNDLGHWVTGILGKLRHVGKCMSWWAAGQMVYCMVVWLHLLGQFRLLKTLKSALGHLLELRSMAWMRAEDLPPIPWDVGPVFKKRSLGFLLYCRNMDSCRELSPEQDMCWPCSVPGNANLLAQAVPPAVWKSSAHKQEYH